MALCTVGVARAAVALFRNWRCQPFAWSFDYDGVARPAGIKVYCITDQSFDFEPTNEVVGKDSVDIVPNIKFTRLADHVKFEFTKRTFIKAMDGGHALGGGGRHGNAKASAATPRF